MGIESVVESNGMAEYLRECGLEVDERDDGFLEVVGHTDVYFGKTVQKVLVIDPDNVGNIIGGVYEAGTSVEEVFEENVEERRFVAVDEDLSDEEREELKEIHREH